MPNENSVVDLWQNTRPKEKEKNYFFFFLRFHPEFLPMSGPGHDDVPAHLALRSNPLCDGARLPLK